MRLRLIALLILIAVAVSLIGCAKLVGEPTEEIVEATIVETRVHPGSFNKIGNVYHFNPPRYYTTLKYNDITENIYGSELYSICHGKNGDTIQCSLITETYDDGSVKQFLEWRK